MKEKELSEKNHRKKAIVTGITGQDGSYLAELLLEKGYTVYGIIRRSSSFNTDRIDHIFQDIHEKKKRLILVYGDLADSTSISAIIREVKPDEFYNLAAQSHVRVSFDIPEYTADIAGLGVIRILEAIRKHSPHTKFYQASTSEMFGLIHKNPQKEDTPFHPRSPYGCAKLMAYWMTRNYRDGYNLFAANGILFNHESPRRGGTFVTRKITRAVANIQAGKQNRLYLGNLEAKRDWGYAVDYVEGMWRILQHDDPDDFILATGETNTVRACVEESFKNIGVEIEWRGEGLEEQGIDKKTKKVLIEIDSRYYRPTEVDLLLGDATKAKEILGWEPKVKFKELVKIMVDADIKAVAEGTDYKFR